MWRQYRTERSKGVNSHLCGLTTSESARSAPSRIDSYPGTIAATPAYAASTCSQIDSRAQMSAIAATGSMLVDDVVPTVATTATGSQPAARSCAIASASASARMRNELSLAIFLSESCPRPSTMTALSMDECVWSEQ